jgi:hypothetical protein
MPPPDATLAWYFTLDQSTILKLATGRWGDRGGRWDDRGERWDDRGERWDDRGERWRCGLRRASAARCCCRDAPENPNLILPLSTSMNDSLRCAAKMAFNFLSFYIGADAALRAEFDSVRRYISGESVEPVVVPPRPR